MDLSDIKIVRMPSGEEIIGIVDLNMVEQGVVSIKKAAILIPTGEGRLGLSPYIPYAELEDDTLMLKESQVVWIVTPQKELSEQYHQSFVSDIIGPTGSIATPSGVGGLKLTT